MPISWVEYRGKEYFLTNKELTTKEGRKLVKYVGRLEDLQGHGAIRHYFY